MKIRFSSRVLLSAFVPVGVLLCATFFALRIVVEERIKDSLRQSLRQTHSFLVRVRSNYELLNSRVLAIVAESPSLKACIELVRTEGPNDEARRTLELELINTARSLGFELMMTTNEQGAVTAAVRADPASGPIRAVDVARLPPVTAGLYSLGPSTFNITKIPVNIGAENIGGIVVGKGFDFGDFTAPTILSRNGKVVMANLPGVSRQEIEAALQKCPAEGECELELHAETYLSLLVDNLNLGDGYVLRSLQSVDSASRPLRKALQEVFSVAAVAASLVMLFLTAVSVRSIVTPLTAFVARLRESERTGTLVDLAIESPIVEIDEMAEAFNRAAQAIREGQGKLSRAYLEFIESMASAIDARDVYTAGHSRRVSEYSCAMAHAMKLSEAENTVIRIGALLHDVGKIGVPDAVLQKPGRLTPEEFALIQLHPSIGSRILARVEGFSPYIPIVELHHENQDGTGYPHGLKGSETPLCARIVHVADAYDAMTSDRTYRKGMSPEQAVFLLRKHSGTQFDPAILEALVASLPASPPPSSPAPFAPDLVNLAEQISAAQTVAPAPEVRV